MKFLIVSTFLLFTISNVLPKSLDQPKLLQKYKLLEQKLAKLDFNDYENLVFINHLVQYNEHYENVTRVQATRGKRVYLGCFKDHRRQRMFRGYAEKGSNAMHIEGCLDKCRIYKFVYGGVQSG